MSSDLAGKETSYFIGELLCGYRRQRRDAGGGYWARAENTQATSASRSAMYAELRVTDSRP